MEQEKNTRAKRMPSVVESIIYLLLVIAVLVISIRLGLGSQMSVFMGALMAIIIALFLGNSWKDLQVAMIKVISDNVTAFLILITVGMLIGVWMIGGTVPSLIYYGLQLVSPGAIIPITFVLCALTSIFTGTSFGSMATMGLAMVGVATGLGVPLEVVAGAAVSGSFFGDKMSPMSDTTNIAPAMSGTTLYEHIGSMMYSTVPAMIVCLIIYTVMGFQYAGGVADTSNVTTMMTALGGSFNISVIALIPAVLVLVVSAFKVPAILGLGSCVIVSVVFAMVLQGVDFVTVVKTAWSGHVSETGVALVDTIVSRGGVKMMQDTIVLAMFACMMGGALNISGLIHVLVNDGLLKVVKKARGLVISNMLYCYAIVAMSGNQVLGIIMGGRTFIDAYDKMDVHRKVLSRTLEDTSTIFAPLVPWSIAAQYAMRVMGVGEGFIPYAFLGMIVPIFSIILACTGIGIWKSDGTKMWGKKVEPQKISAE